MARYRKTNTEIIPEKVDDIVEYLSKKAFGYTVIETVREYSADADGGLKLVKEKKTKKSIPPDISLIKLYCDLTNKTDDYENYTDEQLYKEKERLLSELSQGRKS